jgi:Tfp pilus assembly protein PilW
MKSASESDASGFSLVELTIALTVTLIITGAIYGLLAGGQSAFRREPELTDRQQNIRVAMDLIMRDIANAGSGLPPFVQVFTRNLDACSGCTNGGAPMGLGGVRTDELEMLTNDGNRDNEPLCRNVGTNNASSIRLARNALPAVAPAFPFGPAVILFADGTWTMRFVTGAANGAPVAGESNCTSGTPTALSFATGAPDLMGINSTGTPTNTCMASAVLTVTGTPAMGNANTGITGCTGLPAVGPCCTAVELNFSQVVRYRIRNNAAASNVPELQRYDSASAASGFQTVARGIEDMQVVYTQANGTVSTTGAPTVAVNNFNTLITQVQVTLSSRSEARNIAGMTADANLGTRLRGQLSYTGSPRSALIALANQGGGTLWR